MKTRKLKWEKEDYLDDEDCPCCFWIAYDKKTNIQFEVYYYIIDIVNEKFEVEISSYFGDLLESIYREDEKTTKWNIKRFEKYELEGFKFRLISKTLEKLQSIVVELKSIKI